MKNKTKNIKNNEKKKREKLKTLESINERISNIYNTDTEKAANRRFRTIYNQLEELNEDTQKFLKNLSKKFNKNHILF